ncbi:MAG TPA: hypothetical protein VGV40_03250 [Solirubrobacteraceae bacterium]|nr:hypothetical protein [Solirubrobacteraceae bacterium]
MSLLRLPTLVALALALVLAGCGGEGTPPGLTGVATERPAAALRAQVTELLVGHVYRTALAVDADLVQGRDSERFEQAADQLDETSRALSGILGRAYGAETGERFLALWREHVGLLLDYTTAKRENEHEAAERAIAGLEGFRAEASTLVAAINPNLSRAWMARELGTLVDEELAAIRAAAVRSPEAFERTREAAGRMPGLAAVLAEAIARQFPAQFPGRPDTSASRLRARLTARLSAHAHLLATTAVTGARAGDTSVAAGAARAAVDENLRALRGVLAGVYGAAAGEQFRVVWSDGVALVEDLATARRAKDAEGTAQARGALENWRVEFVELAVSATPGLEAEPVASALETHLDALDAAIGAAAGDDDDLAPRVVAAAQPMASLARLLAAGIARQFPGEFAATGRDRGVVERS